MKLRGRPEAPAKRRGRTLSPRARGAEPPTVHGPLQRLLDRMRTVENLRIAIHILRFCDSQIGEHRVFVQSAFAKEAAPLENSRGFFVLDMAKRVEPSNALCVTVIGPVMF